MVLVKPLSKEEIRRHKALLIEWANAYNQPVTEDSFFLIGNGVEKGVYKFSLNGSELVAVAANRDGLGTLLGEYNKLHHLHRGCPSLFPQPHSHYSSNQQRGELIVMEFLPHLPVDIFDKANIPDFYRVLAYHLGRCIASCNTCTGMYPSEPHDGNILLLNDGNNLDVKFCDASQFRQGGLEEAIRGMVFDKSYRPECVRFIKKFYSGLVEGLVREGKEVEERKIQAILNEYNPVF